jgi:phosphoribosyl-ATP pyrophosphohydrolase/phosphoribosyl-AMP cyclohydrolase
VSKLKFLKTLQSIVEQRLEGGTEGSYTARLAAKGPLKVAQKLGEEGVELALAAVAEDDSRVTEEAADLVYHLIVLLSLRGIKLTEVAAVLERRHAEATR